MANTLKPLAVATLTSIFTTVYTVPPATSFVVGMLHLVNTQAGAVAVRICLVPNAGSPVSTNALFWDFNIPGNDVTEILKGDIWPAQSTLQVWAVTPSVINIKLSGVEQA